MSELRPAEREAAAAEALEAAGQMRAATSRIRRDAVELLPDTEDELVIDLR